MYFSLVTTNVLRHTDRQTESCIKLHYAHTTKNIVKDCDDLHESLYYATLPRRHP